MLQAHLPLHSLPCSFKATPHPPACCHPPHCHFLILSPPPSYLMAATASTSARLPCCCKPPSPSLSDSVCSCYAPPPSLTSWPPLHPPERCCPAAADPPPSGTAHSSEAADLAQTVRAQTVRGGRREEERPGLQGLTQGQRWTQGHRCCLLLLLLLLWWWWKRRGGVWRWGVNGVWGCVGAGRVTARRGPRAQRMGRPMLRPPSLHRPAAAPSRSQHRTRGE